MAVFLNLLVGAAIILVLLWLLNLVLARAALPPDIAQIVRVIVALVVILSVLGWALGFVPGAQPFYGLPRAH